MSQYPEQRRLAPERYNRQALEEAGRVRAWGDMLTKYNARIAEARAKQMSSDSIGTFLLPDLVVYSLLIRFVYHHKLICHPTL